MYVRKSDYFQENYQNHFDILDRTRWWILSEFLNKQKLKVLNESELLQAGHRKKDLSFWVVESLTLKPMMANIIMAANTEVAQLVMATMMASLQLDIALLYKWMI